jgi:hypothetical protein
VGAAAIPTTGWWSGMPPIDSNEASPKLKKPPSPATSQYPVLVARLTAKLRETVAEGW